MKIRSERIGEVEVLRPLGELALGVGDVALREAIHRALDTGARAVVVDLENVTTVDSSAIGELVSGYTTVANKGGKLVLAHLPAKVEDILQITQLISVFQVFENEEEAIQALASH